MGNTLAWMSQEELNRVLDDIASLGFGWVRFDVDWSNVQSVSQDQFDWRAIDRIVLGLNARGMSALPILAYTPEWARPTECTGDSRCAPAEPEDFANFAQVAVKRYSSKNVHNWEIWNEENLNFWMPIPSPSQYTDLLKETYPAIKKQDASATVILGGLGPLDSKSGSITPINFLTKIYGLGANSYFDAVAFHPYTYPYTPSDYAEENAWSQITATNISFRSIMNRYGDENKKI